MSIEAAAITIRAEGIEVGNECRRCCGLSRNRYENVRVGVRQARRFRILGDHLEVYPISLDDHRAVKVCAIDDCSHCRQVCQRFTVRMPVTVTKTGRIDRKLWPDAARKAVVDEVYEP